MSEPSILHLRDGEVVLYHRSRSAKWQARIKVFGRRHRISTGERDPERAGAKACRRQDEMRLRIEVGRAPIARTFKQVAELAIRDMDEQSAAGQGRVAFKDYIGALRRYFIPFFRRHSIDGITWRDLQEFNAWRVGKLKRVPKASTLNNHNAALRKVFATAVAEGWMPEARVPQIKAKGVKGERRPSFTEEEVELMDEIFPTWINRASGDDGGRRSRNPKTPDIRSLLHDYVMFVADTGVRPGTEMRNMRWRDIQNFRHAGADYWLANVRGKTGEREVVLEHFAALALDGRMRLLLPKQPNPSDHIWRLPDGSEPRDLHGAFEQFLIWAKMLEDEAGHHRTLYSLRHFYATKRILAGNVDLHTLARQMGTSIAMIERHYSHLKPRQKAKELAGFALPRNATGKLLSGWLAQRRRKRENDAA